MESTSLILSLVLPIFIILDPFGLLGILMPMIKDFNIKTQNKILRREVFFSYLVMLVFFTFGSLILEALQISQASIQITGGIIFFLFALNLLFPQESPSTKKVLQEPYFVPIATPLIAGPSCLATLIMYSQDDTLPTHVVLIAMTLAWAIAACILISAPRLSILLGKSGIKVLEQIMGLICLMISVDRVFTGIMSFSQESI